MELSQILKDSFSILMENICTLTRDPFSSLMWIRTPTFVDKDVVTCFVFFVPVWQWELNRWPWAPPPLQSPPLVLSFCPASWWATCQLQLAPSPAPSAWARPLWTAQVHPEVSSKTPIRTSADCCLFRKLIGLSCPALQGVGRHRSPWSPPPKIRAEPHLFGAFMTSWLPWRRPSAHTDRLVQRLSES